MASRSCPAPPEPNSTDRLRVALEKLSDAKASVDTSARYVVPALLVLLDQLNAMEDVQTPVNAGALGMAGRVIVETIAV